MNDYERIERAIMFITERVTEQPSLAEIAAHLHMSPFHFQRLFCRWAGVSPKRFLQVLTLERAKPLLRQSRSILEVSEALGLTSASRLYDHFIQIEAMTPGAYKSKGEGLLLEYGLHETPFGSILVATTDRGLCRAAFTYEESLDVQLNELREAWPGANLCENPQSTAPVAKRIFDFQARAEHPLSIYVSGTNFQVAVWRALLRIPPGKAVSYSKIADMIGRPGSARAVGGAVGANPIAFAIPCHRVIQQSGALGGFYWGTTRKQAMQLWELAQAAAVKPTGERP